MLAVQFATAARMSCAAWYSVCMPLKHELIVTVPRHKRLKRISGTRSANFTRRSTARSAQRNVFCHFANEQLVFCVRRGREVAPLVGASKEHFSGLPTGDAGRFLEGALCPKRTASVA